MLLCADVHTFYTKIVHGIRAGLPNLTELNFISYISKTSHLDLTYFCAKKKKFIHYKSSKVSPQVILPASQREGVLKESDRE